jgi:Tfp pilus assembly protein PilO
MGNFSKTFLKNIHFLLIVYTLYQVYDKYQKKSVQIETIEGQRIVLEKEVTDLKEKIAKSAEYKSNLEIIKQRLEEIYGQIQIAQRQLPNDTNDTQILSSFSQEAKNLNVNINNLRPGQETKEQFYFIKDYSFDALGTWLQVLVFLESLNKRERIFNVKSMAIKNSTSKQRGRFKLLSINATLEAFRYNPEYVEEKIFEEIKNTAAPVKPNNPVNAKEQINEGE